MNIKVKNLDSTRYDEHYQKLLDAVKNKYFYTAIHEAEECIIYGKQGETGRFKRNIKAQIEFKSTPDMFDKEHSGIKNNTVRFVNRDEDKEILATIDNIKSIRIINTNDVMCNNSFVRTITDITRYVNPDDLKIIYIFTWRR